MLPVLICRRKTGSLRRDQFHGSLWLAALLDDYTDSHKHAPHLIEPQDLQYYECILGDESWRLVAMHQRPKSNLPALLQF